MNEVTKLSKDKADLKAITGKIEQIAAESDKNIEKYYKQGEQDKEELSKQALVEEEYLEEVKLALEATKLKADAANKEGFNYFRDNEYVYI